MTTKTFDCVAMKRRGAEKVRQQLEGLTPTQELEFWRRQTEELRRLQQQVRQGRLPDLK